MQFNIVFYTVKFYYPDYLRDHKVLPSWFNSETN